MRTMTILIGACVLASPLVLAAEQIKPRIDVDFGQGLKPLPKAPPVTFDVPAATLKELEARARLKAAPGQAPRQRDPIDCAMIRRVDPNYRSAMPVLKPSADVKLPMKVIVPPPCPEK